ncbi:hypothetical protein PLESTM_000249400 [Pleodorina starrii]|nr:hypothetical protein PLESTM_000249400 [Pleodorina starrii]
MEDSQETFNLQPPRCRKRPHELDGDEQDGSAKRDATEARYTCPQAVPNPHLTFETFSRELLKLDRLLDASPASPWAALGQAAGLSFLRNAAYPPEPEQQPSEANISASRLSLARRGYARLPSPEVLWGPNSARAHGHLCSRLVSACRLLRRLGWNLAWILLYDEAWLLARMYGPALRRLSYGRLELNPDFVFFHVEPGSRGWPPHRDRPSMPRGLQEGPQPTSQNLPHPLPVYVTCWIALTAATPDNGCIYVVPADLDPLYDSGTTLPPDATAVTATVGAVSDATGPGGYADSPVSRRVEGGVDASGSAGGGGSDGAGGGPSAHAARAEYGSDDVSVPDLQAVRALPAAAGEALLWSGRLLHWGGAADAEATDPRVAMSFAASAPEFEPPSLRGADLTAAASELPTLRQRLVLVSVQLAVHEHQEPLSPPLAAVLRRLEDALGDEAGQPPSSSPST